MVPIKFLFKNISLNLSSITELDEQQRWNEIMCMLGFSLNLSLNLGIYEGKFLSTGGSFGFHMTKPLVDLVKYKIFTVTKNKKLYE